MMALCFSEAGKAPDWIQLTPVSAGKIEGMDGRSWTVRDADAVIANSMKVFGRGTDRLAIDYNHASDPQVRVGSPAPAAGWIVELAKAGPDGEPGFWGKVEWTAPGANAVAGREYGWVSPVLFSDKQDQLLAIGRVSLTNNPNLLLKALNSLQENNVDFTKIAAALGLPATATEDDIIAAIRAMTDEETGEPKLNAVHTRLLLTAAGLKTDAKVDDSLVTGLCVKLKTTAASGQDGEHIASLKGEINDLRTQIVNMRNDGAKMKAEVAVEDAIKAGKLTPAERAWAIDYCTAEPGKFADLVGIRPQILTNGRVAPKDPPQDGVHQLDDNQKSLCTQMGIAEEDFAEGFAKKLNSKQEAA